MSPDASKKLWLIITFILAISIILFFLLRNSQLFRPAPPPEPELPEADTVEELIEANEDAPIPEEITVDSDDGRDIPSFTEDEHWYGSHSARYTLIWYASLSNRLTSLMYPEIKQFTDDHENVSLVFRHFPLDTNILDYPAARVSECIAQDLGNEAFWIYLDDLLSQKRFSREDIVTSATNLGMSGDRMNECYLDEASEEVHGNVFIDIQAAWIMGGITGSPAIVIADNDATSLRFVDRAESRQFMEKVLEVMEAN